MRRFNDGHSSTSEAVTSFPSAHRNSTQVMFSTAPAIVACGSPAVCAAPLITIEMIIFQWLYAVLWQTPAVFTSLRALSVLWLISQQQTLKLGCFLTLVLKRTLEIHNKQ